MYTLSLFLLTLFSLYIGVFAFFRWDASFLRNLSHAPVQVLFILGLCRAASGGAGALYRLVNGMSEKNQKRLGLSFFLILAVGQLGFLAVIRPQLRYDPLKIFDMAIEMLRTHTISGTYETGYFARYTNNYPLTILTYWLLKLLQGVGVPESGFMLAVQLVNVVCILVSVVLGYLILKELKGRTEAVFFLGVCVLCPLSYVWAGYFYTGQLFHAVFNGNCVSGHPDSEGPGCFSSQDRGTFGPHHGFKLPKRPSHASFRAPWRRDRLRV